MLKKIIKKRAYEGNKIEDNLLFVTLQTQIVGLDMNNGYKQIFLSDRVTLEKKYLCLINYRICVIFVMIKTRNNYLSIIHRDMPICTRCRKESACRKNFICGQ